MPSYVDLLNMEGHQEGGYFSLLYKSSMKVRLYTSEYSEIPEKREHSERYSISSIYFLLEKKGFSSWHRLKSDEIWHYYDGGSPIYIYTIDEAGQLSTHILGNPTTTENASFHVVIQAGLWFAAEVKNKLTYGLVGCTVAPAFEYEDFELAELYRDELIERLPQHRSIIDKFIQPKLERVQLQKNQHEIQQALTSSPEFYMENLRLIPHDKGGHFAINYISKKTVLPLDGKNAPKVASSSMYILLKNQETFQWNQTNSDLILHFYDGNSPVIVQILENDTLRTRLLGNPQENPHASFQVIIKAGDLFTIELSKRESFCLLGLTMSLGGDGK